VSARDLDATSALDPVIPGFPLCETRPDDVFIVPYPRSGNMGMRFLIANALEPETTIAFQNIGLHRNL
jgi:hypothetical protein